MSNPEKMLYQVNKSGSNLVILFIVLNMVFTIFTLKYMPINFWVGAFIMYNIVLSLISFLGSTKYKTYQAKWAYGGLVVAVTQAIRFLTIPSEFDADLRMFLVVALELSVVALVAGSVITISKSKRKAAYEEELANQVN